jgi:hypothetical protein
MNRSFFGRVKHTIYPQCTLAQKSTVSYWLITPSLLTAPVAGGLYTHEPPNYVIGISKLGHAFKSTKGRQYGCVYTVFKDRARGTLYD